MKTILVCLGFVSLLLVSLKAAATSFDGTWAGTGHIDNADRNEPAKGQFLVTIRTTDGHLKVSECSQSINESRGTCIESDYEIRDETQLWKNERRIGDIFPDRIIVLEGHAQVAEQMIFDLSESGTLRYQYSYVNLDGAAQHRKAVLHRDR